MLPPWDNDAINLISLIVFLMCSANYFTINTHTPTTLFKTHIAFDGDKSTSENEKAEITRETTHAIALLLQTGYNTVTKSKKKKIEMKK
jgi:hypothetical protein